MRHVLLALLSFLTLPSCVTYAVDEIRPDYDGTVVYRTRGNSLFKFSDYAHTALNVQATTGPGGTTSYALVFGYSADSWMFVKAGESLVMSIDGERVAFRSARGSEGNRDAHGGGVSERAWYPISQEGLRQIAQASEVKFKVRGSKGYLELSFGEGNFDHFRRFVAEYASADDGESPDTEDTARDES